MKGELLSDAGCRSWPGEGCQASGMIGFKAAMRDAGCGLSQGTSSARGMMRARRLNGVIEAVRREGA